jgi:hypothetical protein
MKRVLSGSGVLRLKKEGKDFKRYVREYSGMLGKFRAI